MGLFDIFRRKDAKVDINVTRTALDEARDPGGNSDAITSVIQRILSIGLDGRGVFKGAQSLAADALKKADGDVERAVDSLARTGIRTAAGGGFLTSIGGFVTMPVAIPANVFEFYVLATRTVGAIATLRGYDVKDPMIRTAVLLTLVGSKSTDILNKAGVTMGSGALAGLATRGLPRAAVMMINKAVGFRVLRSVGEKTLARFGRAVPVLGGGVGAVVDGAMMSKIAQQARQEFPKFVADQTNRDWGVR